MSKEHNYNLDLEWTGNSGPGTIDYRSYERSYIISSENKGEIHGSSDPAFRGDSTRYNPEELLLASLSSCHMLWFLHLCTDNKIVVTAYTDSPSGVMEETDKGGGRFKEVTLRPVVTVADEGMTARLDELHVKANKLCFIASSVNFAVSHKASAKVKS